MPNSAWEDRLVNMSTTDKETYTVAAFTMDSTSKKGFAENAWDVSDPDRIAAMVKNLTNPESGIRRVVIEINPEWNTQRPGG
jgi:hypothetical protein